MASKVAVLNANARSASGGKPKEDVVAEKATATTKEPSKKDDTATPKGSSWRSTVWNKVYAGKDDDGKKLALYIAAIIIAYIAAHIAPESKEHIYRGVAALIVMHFIWTFSAGKASIITWIIVLGMLWYFVFAWIYPKDAPRILDAGWGLSQKVVTSVADTVVSANESYGKAPAANAPTAHESKVRWLPEVIASDPNQFIELPHIPSGVRFTIYCDGGEMKYYWRGGPQDGKIQDCGMPLGENLYDLRIGVAPKTDEPVTVSIKLEY